jgi:hypothetical protein
MQCASLYRRKEVTRAMPILLWLLGVPLGLILLLMLLGLVHF